MPDHVRLGNLNRISSMRASIIIPTCGAAWGLAPTLRRVAEESTLHAGVEVLVVDNNAPGPDSLRVRDLCGESGTSHLRYVNELSPGATAARHRGVRESTGDILIFVDDDVEVSHGWLAAVLDAFERSGAEIVGGPSIPRFSGSIPDWLWAQLHRTPYGGWGCGALSLLDIGRTVEGIDPIWIWTLNFSIYRETFLRLGGLHPDLVPPALQRWQGDGETGLTYKALASGTRCIYSHEALIHHLIQPNRLCAEYFERRSYFQGICDSFTKIRQGEEAAPSHTGPRQLPGLPGPHATPWSHAAHEIEVGCTHAYNRGWAFHQREVAADPGLLAWVRRKDFLDADIRGEANAADSD
jgi:glucosyl-dolichyl phosphate glucuronosyltransferase